MNSVKPDTVESIKTYLDSWSNAQRVRATSVKYGIFMNINIPFDEAAIKRFSTSDGIDKQILEFEQLNGWIYYMRDLGDSFDMRRICVNKLYQN